MSDMATRLTAGIRVSPDDLQRVSDGFTARATSEGLVEAAYALMDSPVGALILAATDRGLARVYFVDGSVDDALAEMARSISPRILEVPSRLDPARAQLDSYFEGRLKTFDLALDMESVRGFSRRVLQSARAIPYGATASYREVAAASGSARATRAAGSALGRNPIPIVVPCHRVLRTGGHLGGYGGGLDRKRQLLRIEGVLPAE